MKNREALCRLQATSFSHGDDFDPQPARRLDRRGYLDGVDRRRRLSGRQVGRPSLIATSRKPNRRTVPGARWLRAGSYPHSGDALRAFVDGRRLRTLLVGLGIVALTGLTTWAVASVSIWLVPVYLLLMIVTFATPHAGRTQLPGTESSSEVPGAEADESRQSLGADYSEGMGEPHPDVEPVPDTLASESADVLTPLTEPPGTVSAKPRRSRSRSRKAAKTAVESVPEASPVTWIRVGPGKFVRADASVQDSTQAQAEEVVPDVAIPATDLPESVVDPSDFATDIHLPMDDAVPAVTVERVDSDVTIPATDSLVSGVDLSDYASDIHFSMDDTVSADVADVHFLAEGHASEILSYEEVAPVADVSTDAPELLTPTPVIVSDVGLVIDNPYDLAPAPLQSISLAISEESTPFVPSESIPPGEELIPSPVEDVSGSDAEEYGIAPSAFGAENSELPEAESLVSVVPDELVTPDSDPVGLVNRVGVPTGSETHSDGFGSRRQRTGMRKAFLTMGIANVSRGKCMDSASSRRRVRTRLRTRSAVRCLSLSDSRLRQAARGAFGRTLHLKRAWRPRSPPGRKA